MGNKNKTRKKSNLKCKHTRLEFGGRKILMLEQVKQETNKEKLEQEIEMGVKGVKERGVVVMKIQ